MIQKVGNFRLKETMRTFAGQFKPNVPIILANTVQNHFVEGFRLGGFRTDASMGGWRSRQYTKGKGTRAILVKRGILRRDILKRVTTFNLIVVGTSSLTDSYASIHNEGGKIKITDKMRKFFWAMYSKAKGKTTPNMNKFLGSASIFGPTTEKEYWKSLALHQGTHIEIPKREFIGNSRNLEVKLEKQIDQELLKLFK